LISCSDGTRATTWTNTSGGASTASSTDSTNDVYGSGDGGWSETSTSVYCNKEEEEEELFVEEEPFKIPGDEHLPNIRDYFGITKEPP